MPAIHPAKSNPPPAIALFVAPVSGEERECCSNSARVSGSTVQMTVSHERACRGKGRVHTVLHQFGHAEGDSKRDDGQQDHRVFDQIQR